MSILPTHLPLEMPNNFADALPPGTVTFLFSDIEGSTRLWERFPDAMPGVLARHDTLLQGVIEGNGGRVFKKGGDSFCAVFRQADRALRAALAVQTGLHREEWRLPESCAPRVRLALHSGTAEQRDDDYFGVSLSRTARLLAAAHGGQTLVSESAALLASEELPESVRLRSLGRHRLKDLAQPQEIFQVVHPALPADFPPLRSLESFAHNLPGQLTSFIGREGEMAAARRRLSETRLLTLTGTGGAGKSRLALQVAADALDDYPDGAWLVELASLSDPALLPQAVAGVLGVGERAEQSLMDTLADTLRPKTLLLILDNCEHLVEACAHLAEELLRTCPRLRLLATSREALEIGGETVLPVPSLALPPPTEPWERVAQSEAVRLFVDRATSALPTFRLSAGNAPAVAQVCGRLDGIPLALELAAARVKVLSPEQISARLSDDRFRLLTGGSRTADARQQTLRALIDWSHDLLLPAEQTLLRRLSVFAGGLSLEAAETVCADGAPQSEPWPESEPLEERDILDLLSRLVAKSLVVVEPPEDGQVRYHLLENLRQYACERLAETDEGSALAARHRDFFLAFAEEAETELKGSRQVFWLNRLEREHDNLRAALGFCQNASEPREKALRLASALYRFWYVRGYLTEGLRWLEHFLGRAGAVSDDLQARACTAAGVLCWSLGDLTQSRAFHEASLRLRRAMQDNVGIARSLANLGLVASREEDYVATRSLFEESLALYREGGTKNDVALMLHNLGTLLSELKDFEAARGYLEESLQFALAENDERQTTATLHNLGLLAGRQGDHAAAAQYYLESLEHQKNFGDKQQIASSLCSLAAAVGSCRQSEFMCLLFAAEEAYRAQTGLPHLDPHGYQENAVRLQEAKAELGEPAFDALWMRGRSLTLEQAIQYAAENLGSLARS